jgi:hypothetical protein
MKIPTSPEYTNSISSFSRYPELYLAGKMKKIIFSVLACFLFACTSMPMVSDGSITITTNGLANVADDTLHIKADVDGMFELDIRNVTG